MCSPQLGIGCEDERQVEAPDHANAAGSGDLSTSLGSSGYENI